MANPDGFTVKPVVNRTINVLDGHKTLGLILHVQAGNNALSGWFNNPAASASSTWWAGKAGGREQYGDPDCDKFWAQSAGNSTYHSVETEGYPSEPLTSAQIDSCATIYAWGHLRYGWPLKLAEKPGESGLGWHGMGGSAWGGHTGCPGDIRKAQRKDILRRAQELLAPSAPQGDELSAQDVADIKDYVGKILVGGYTDGGKPFPGMAKVDIETQRRVTALAAQVSALSAAVKALAESKGADSAALIKAVTDATDRALSGLEITLKTGV